MFPFHVYGTVDVMEADDVVALLMVNARFAVESHPLEAVFRKE